MKKTYIFIGLIICALAGTEYWLQSRITWQKETQRLGHNEARKYYHPIPQTGEWAAIYTADFAEKFNLPKENISSDLNSFVEYAEILIIPTTAEQNQGLLAKRYHKRECVLNILTKQNHDISLHGLGILPSYYDPSEKYYYEKHNRDIKDRINWQIERVNEHMSRIEKPLQYFNIDKYRASYRQVYNIGVHSQNIIHGYDYFSRIHSYCSTVLSSLKNNHNIAIPNLLKASFIKKHFNLKNLKDYNNHPKDRFVTIKNSSTDHYTEIIVPNSLARAIYAGTHIPIRPPNAYINSITEIPKAAIGIGVVLLLGLGAVLNGDIDFYKKTPEYKSFYLPQPWPEGVPSHFKLIPSA